MSPAPASLPAPHPRRAHRQLVPGRLLVAVVATALTLTGCGGDDGSGDIAATASTPPSAAPSPAPECPIAAAEVPPPPGISPDLTAKPVVPPSTTPAPTELQYSDIVVGTGPEAVTGSSVAVKYVGAIYETGAEFDSSWKRDPTSTIPFGICQSGVIPGFAVGPSGMKVGGRRLITIPSRFGYQEAGSPPAIPGGATLVFVVDLVSVG